MACLFFHKWSKWILGALLVLLPLSVSAMTVTVSYLEPVLVVPAGAGLKSTTLYYRIFDGTTLGHTKTIVQTASSVHGGERVTQNITLPDYPRCKNSAYVSVWTRALGVNGVWSTYDEINKYYFGRSQPVCQFHTAPSGLGIDRVGDR